MAKAQVEIGSRPTTIPRRRVGFMVEATSHPSPPILHPCHLRDGLYLRLSPSRLAEFRRATAPRSPRDRANPHSHAGFVTERR
jgi:hypothetical protein